jgi:hypothetical protein
LLTRLGHLIEEDGITYLARSENLVYRFTKIFTICQTNARSNFFQRKTTGCAFIS